MVDTIRDTQFGDLSEDQIADLLEGVPDIITDIPDPRDPIVPVSTQPAMSEDIPMDSDDTTIVLVNLRYINEFIFIDPNLDPTGVGVQFFDGHYVAKTRELAEEIKRAAPYVLEEPKEGPIFEHKQSHFKTRNMDVFTLYCEYYAENNA